MTDFPVPLRCPISGAALELVASGGGGEPALADAERRVRYPVVDGIPQLLAASLLDAERAEEIREETETYDRLASGDRAELAETARRLMGAPLVERHREGRTLGGFPEPVSVWLDSAGCPDTQEAAYRHLAPLAGAVFLQLGGSGSHAVKALLAGAAHAGLLSPSQEEIRLGRDLAEHFGVGDRFFGVRAVGEAIPFGDVCLDRVYGGGCLHHTDIDRSLPELARVLRPGGRAGFVDPRGNPIYAAWTRALGTTVRFCREDGVVHDHPLDAREVRAHATDFARCEVYASGGPLRYGIVLAARTTPLSLPPAWGAPVLRAERRLLRRLRLDGLFGTMAVMLER